MLRKSGFLDPKRLPFCITLACATSLHIAACGSGDPPPSGPGGDAGGAGVDGSRSASSSGSSSGSFGGSDAASQTCLQGQTQSCWTGDPSQRGKGACHDGVQQCTSKTSGELTASTWGPCSGEQLDCGDAGASEDAAAEASPISTCGPSSPPPVCDPTTVPATLTLTLSGFVTCSCFNGTFTLTQSTIGGEEVWSSPPITGCPGQTQTAAAKFIVMGNEFGITDLSGIPGSGASDGSPATTVVCAPFQASGGGSCNGNISTYCPSNEDLGMMWTITQ